MKHHLKKYWPIGLVLLLIVTNPSISSFKAFRGSNTYRGLYRTLNLFMASVYNDGGAKYVGVLGNFIRLPERRETANNATTHGILVDSAATTSDVYTNPSNGDGVNPFVDDSKSYISKNNSSNPFIGEVHKYILWKKLNESGLYTKSYSEFEFQFSTSSSINKLYVALNKAEYYTKSESEFKSQFF